MVKSVLFYVLTIALVSGSAPARAEEDSRVEPAGDAATNKAELPKPVKREDIDQEITNSRLRAATGAKSLVSLQSSFNFNGGSVQNPLAAERPQLMPGSVVEKHTALQGQISAKFRATDHDNINVGVGIDWTTPGHEGEHGQVDDPFLQYSRVYKLGDVQNVFTVTGEYYSSDELRSDGSNWKGDLQYIAMTHVGKTKWEVGGALEYTREFYTAEPSAGQTLNTAALYPFAEYEFNPTFSFRTVYRGFTYNDTRTNGFSRQEPTQSLGLGTTIARDVYLYPNIQWVWSDIRAEKTNVALTAYINL